MISWFFSFKIWFICLISLNWEWFYSSGLVARSASEGWWVNDLSRSGDWMQARSAICEPISWTDSWFEEDWLRLLWIRPEHSAMNALRLVWLLGDESFISKASFWFSSFRSSCCTIKNLILSNRLGIAVREGLYLSSRDLHFSNYTCWFAICFG